MVVLSDPVESGPRVIFYIVSSRLMVFPKTASCHEAAVKAIKIDKGVALR